MILAGLCAALAVFALFNAITWMIWVNILSALICLCFAALISFQIRHVTLNAEINAVFVITGAFAGSNSQKLDLTDILSAHAKPHKISVPFHYQTSRGTLLFFETKSGPHQVFKAMLPDIQGTQAADLINEWLDRHRATP